MSPSAKVINQARKSLLSTSLPSRLQTYSALRVKAKKTVQWSELFPRLGISAPSLCSPIVSWYSVLILHWKTICTSLQTTDMSLWDIWTSSPFNTSGFLWKGAWVHGQSRAQWHTTIISGILDDQETWGLAYPRGLPLPEEPRNAPAGRQVDSGVKTTEQWQHTWLFQQNP